MMLRELQNNGAVISGDNPWAVDTRRSGVKLKGQWNEAASCLEVAVVGRDWYVPRSTIWKEIDELMRQIRAMPEDKIVGTAVTQNAAQKTENQV